MTVSSEVFKMFLIRISALRRGWVFFLEGPGAVEKIADFQNLSSWITSLNINLLLPNVKKYMHVWRKSITCLSPGLTCLTESYSAQISLACPVHATHQENRQLSKPVQFVDPLFVQLFDEFRFDQNRRPRSVEKFTAHWRTDLLNGTPFFLLLLLRLWVALLSKNALNFGQPVSYSFCIFIFKF